MKNLCKLTAVLIGITASPSLWAQTPQMFADGYSTFVETLRAQCTEFEAGEFDAPTDAASYTTDFNGDGITDPIVEEYRFACSSSASMFSGGTGGSSVHVFASRSDGGYDQFTFLGHSVMVIIPQTRPDRPVLLMPVHSGQCDVTAEPGYAAYVWSKEGQFVSTSGPVATSQ
jgi:hypothetical protein